MSKQHLIKYDGNISNYRTPMVEISGWEYWSKRLIFWKWRLHRTMGRPVLIPRKKEPSNV